MIVFSDLDGTFFDSQKRIPDVNMHALDELARRGMHFVPCSGRPLTGIVPEIVEHPAVRYAVSSNGATVTDVRSGETLLRVTLGLERTLAIHELCAGRDVTFDYFADDRCYVERSVYDGLEHFIDDPFVLASMRSTRIPFDGAVEEFGRTLTHIERIAIYWNDPADRAYLVDAIAKTIPDVSIVSSYATNIEVSDASASKGAALAWLCDHLDMPVADAVAFGDNINDISMIEATGTGVAVANAEPEVIAAADAVAASNDDGGVGAFVLERLGA